MGHDWTAWLLFQSGAQSLQKRTTAEPLHDTLVPYALGFKTANLQPERAGTLPASTTLMVFRGDLHAHSSNSNEAAGNANPETSMRMEDANGNLINSNHSNVFLYEGSGRDFSAFTGHASFFNKLASKTGALAQFNHPGSDRFTWKAPTATDSTDVQMELIEFNGAPDDATRFQK
ncbi:MAG TPA: hypothetical protein VGK67_28525 [Myxococcales bacterium]